MRFLILLFLLVLIPGHASADPFTITANIAFLLTTVGLPASTAFTVAQVAISTALVAGPTVISAALRRKPGGANIDTQTVKRSTSVPESSEINAEGLVRLGGVLGLADSPDGYKRYRLLFHCTGITDGVENHYLGNREVILDPNGDVSSPPYAKFGGSWVNIKNKIGDGAETAWSDLVTDFDYWTSNHRARGIAQTLVRYDSPGVSDDDFLKLYQNGVPAYERVSREGLVYDPRDESTAYSANGILRCLHVARRALRLELTDFDLDFVADEADRADATVSTLTGTEPRSRISGVWASEDNRTDTFQSVLLSAGADFWVGPNGKFRIGLIDDQPTATFSIPARHISTYAKLSGPERPRRPNMARVWFYSSERDFELTELTIHTFDGSGDYEGPAWARVETEIERYGEQPLDIRLEFCPSASQAQRIARRIFEEARAETGTIDANFYGVGVLGHRRVSIEFDDLDRSPVCKVTQPNIDDENQKTVIPFMVNPTLAAWNPATDEVAAPEPVPDLTYTGDIDAPTAPNESVIVTFPTIVGDPLSGQTETRWGGFSKPSGTTSMEGTYRTYTGGLPDAYLSTTEGGVTTSAPYALVSGSLSELTDFRVRAFNSEDEGSNWSEIFQSTPAVDNSAPGAPTIVVSPNGPITEVSVFVTAPTDLNVAYVLITADGESDVKYAARPSGTLSYDVILPAPETEDVTIIWTAQAFSANDTGGPTATDSVTIPGTGP